ncbi:MAG: Mbeg1-like protein [Candidatus Omnitrophota bacterium]
MDEKFVLNNGTTRFNLGNALALAKAAELAYKTFEEVRSVTQEEWGFSEVKWLEGPDDTQAYFVINDTTVVLAFRGTESTQDWLTDAAVRLVDAVIGRTHRGFTSALDNLWGDIEANLLSAVVSGRTLWITGHSLGGALAALTASRINQQNIDINGVYTFGQPRVGDDVFADHCADLFGYRLFRLVNDEDIVTRVPPRLSGYDHFGRTYLIDHKGTLHRGASWWDRWLNQSESASVRALDRYDELSGQYPDAIQDHSIVRYIKAIRKCLIAETGVQNFKDYLDSI